MTNIQRAPTKNQLEQYLRKGLTQAQIVEEWEKESGTRVSRSTIAMSIRRNGLESAHERPRYEDLLPWLVKSEHKDHIEARMLRLEGRRRTGRKLTASDLKWLEGWKASLMEQNAVVAYAPDTEEGFYWVPREEQDGDGLVRKGAIR